MEVNQSDCFPLLRLVFSGLRVQHSHWNCAVRAPYRCEFNICNRMDVLLGEAIYAKNLQVMPALVVEIAFSSQMQRCVVMKKFLDLG